MSNLKIIRERRGFTQSQLALLSGVSLQDIQDYEQGIQNIDQQAQLMMLHKLATALSCNVNDLF